MFFWLKSSVSKQLLGLLLCVLLSTLIGFYFEFHPLLKFEFLFILRGIAAGFLASVILAIFHILLLLTFPRLHGAALRKALTNSLNSSLTVVIGRAIFAAGGEEVLLRGYVLGLMSYSGKTLSLLINGLLTFLCYFQRPSMSTLSVVRMIEGLFYASLFLQHRSLVLVGLAHATSEVIRAAAAQKLPWQTFLERNSYRIRDFYGFFNSTRSTLSQRI